MERQIEFKATCRSATTKAEVLKHIDLTVPKGQTIACGG